MDDTRDTDDPPTFEEAFRGEDVEQRVYGTTLQTREPATAGAIADRVGCDPKTARKYLEWFADLGVVTRHDGHPATYERNDAYFEWRRVDHLAATNSIEDLQGRVQELTTRIVDYQDEYDAETPAAVDAVTAAEARDGRSIDSVYGDLADWQTALDERRRYERARQQRLGGESEQASG